MAITTTNPGRMAKEKTANETKGNGKTVIPEKDIVKERTPVGIPIGTGATGAKTTIGAKETPTKTTAANLRTSKKKRRRLNR